MFVLFNFSLNLRSICVPSPICFRLALTSNNITENVTLSSSNNNCLTPVVHSNGTSFYSSISMTSGNLTVVLTFNVSGLYDSNSGAFLGPSGNISANSTWLSSIYCSLEDVNTTITYFYSVFVYEEDYLYDYIWLASDVTSYQCSSELNYTTGESNFNISNIYVQTFLPTPGTSFATGIQRMRSLLEKEHWLSLFSFVSQCDFARL